MMIRVFTRLIARSHLFLVSSETWNISEIISQVYSCLFLFVQRIFETPVRWKTETNLSSRDDRPRYNQTQIIMESRNCPQMSIEFEYLDLHKKSPSRIQSLTNTTNWSNSSRNNASPYINKWFIDNSQKRPEFQKTSISRCNARLCPQ
jgi:hypothetical protein